MARPLRPLLLACAGLAAVLLASPASAGPVDLPTCPIGAEPILVPTENPDGLVHFTVGVILRWEQDGACRSLHVDETFEVPWTQPCGVAADAGPNGDGSYHYRVGAGVQSTGTNHNACLGDSEEGDTPALPPPPQPPEVCDDLGVEPIVEPQPNPDGSVHFTVGFVLHWQDASGCHGLHFDQTFTVPWTEPCDPDAGASPNGDGTYHYRAGAAVSSTGTNGGACIGPAVEGDTPAVP
jgi:hypothetical protein